MLDSLEEEEKRKVGEAHEFLVHLPPRHTTALTARTMGKAAARSGWRTSCLPDLGRNRQETFWCRKGHRRFMLVAARQLAPNINVLAIVHIHLFPKLTVVGNMERTQPPPPSGNSRVHKLSRTGGDHRVFSFPSPGGIRMVRSAFPILYEFESR